MTGRVSGDGAAYCRGVTTVEAIFGKASERETGGTCRQCGGVIGADDDVANCLACGSTHHRRCWDEKGCGSYACAPAQRPLDPQAGDVLRISASEIASAQPLPSTSGARPRPVIAQPPDRPPGSRLGFAAFVVALAGIPLFGALTGLVAMVMAMIALVALRGTAWKTKRSAMAGLLIGVVDVVGWVFLLMYLLEGGTHYLAPRTADYRIDASRLRSVAAPIARALRANVLITTSQVLETGLGSGVILAIEGGKATILTNRHVVDHKYSSNDRSPADLSSLKPVDVCLIDQSHSEGIVTWVAEDGVDLAIVTAPCATSEATAARWPASHAANIGDPVFAVGNPNAWGWTHTQGAISQFRKWAGNSRTIEVIQSSAAINPGNSGGGLYDHDGGLLGITTWTADKRFSEGIGFSIALDELMLLSPPAAIVRAASAAKETP